ncbi:hypothetical protein N7466_003821 [Penicillium verhagenii]|uniref:uncharacterized protein n=1 Tax=Penicillium verhagenii TaxID=1562060 RepID=UPI0025455AD9|nr:uncharacterized protein N7466_003821 [Penicillium verhagenii]KAJ5934274.1 hypothetical protein N7466_003821 [Penicillium verhagenii]
MSNLPTRPKRRIRHTKSRNGCFPCKNRRVKCDEERPICGACFVRNDECTFPPQQETRDRTRRQTHSRRHPTRHDGAETDNPPEAIFYPLDFNIPDPRPANPELSSSDLNMQDLNLLQHYILHTSKNISLNPRKTLIWERVIPEMAANDTFLMHLLLALAGLDILTAKKPGQHVPMSSDSITLRALVEHHQKGLRGLQEKFHSIETSGEALFAGSMLIVGFAFGSLRDGNLNVSTRLLQESSTEYNSPGPLICPGKPGIEWLRLVRGVTSLAAHSWKTLKLSRLRPLLIFNNANEDWKLLDPDHVPTTVPPGLMRSASLSEFSRGAPQAISELRGFLSALKATMLGVDNDLHPSPISGTSSAFDETSQLRDLFEAQSQAIDVIEKMYLRIKYVLQLQQIEACPTYREVQAEIEDAAIASWPTLVPEIFISSLDSSDDRPDIPVGFSFVVLTHLYLLLTLLDDLWYLGENFGAEIKKINSLVTDIGNPELSKLMEWPMDVVRLQAE